MGEALHSVLCVDKKEQMLALQAYNNLISAYTNSSNDSLGSNDNNQTTASIW